MADERIIHIEWSGPHSLAGVDGFRDQRRDRGLYQIYGHHPVYLAGLNAVVLTADGDVTLFISPEEVDVAREINSGIEIQSFAEGGIGLDLGSTSTLLVALRGF